MSLSMTETMVQRQACEVQKSNEIFSLCAILSAYVRHVVDESYAVTQKVMDNLPRQAMTSLLARTSRLVVVVSSVQECVSLSQGCVAWPVRVNTLNVPAPSNQ